MHGYAVNFTLTKNDWLLVEPSLSELFEAIVVKPERENDPTSRETVMLIFEHDPQAESLQEQLDFVFENVELRAPKIIVEKLPDIDWLQKVYEDIKPIDAGRFFVHGSHIKESIPADKVAILIEAAAAFGTGEHPTTKSCLLLFDRLLDHEDAPKTVLDMGTGSGILAIAAAKTLHGATPEESARIIGVDIDDQSVIVAANHARDNGVHHDIIFIAGNGFRQPLVQETAPFDLVFANILAQPLIDMAADLAAIGRKHVILSGFTEPQQSYVLAPYEKLGFKQHDSVQINEWVALWLTKE